MSNNKKEKSKIWAKILAAVLAGMTILSVLATCIFAIIELVG